MLKETIREKYFSNLRIQVYLGTIHVVVIAYLFLMLMGPFNSFPWELQEKMFLLKHLCMLFATGSLLIKLHEYKFDFFIQLFRYKWIYFFVIFYGFVFLSNQWTLDPPRAAHMSRDIITKIIFALYLGTRYKPIKLAEVFGKCSVIFIFISLGAVLMGIKSNEGFGGGYGHKNWFGQMSLIQFTTYMFLIMKSRRLKPFWIMMSMLTAFNLLVSKNMGTVGFAIPYLGSVLIVAVYMLKAKARLSFVLSLVLLIPTALYLSLEFSEYIFMSLGKSSSLTGRDILWKSAEVFLESDKFWLGRGLQGVWTMENPEAVFVWSVAGWKAPSAHNGFIDLLLEFGVVGFFFYIIMVLSFVSFTLKWIKKQEHHVDKLYSMWPFAICLYIFFSNAFETAIFIYINSFFPLAIVTSITCAMISEREYKHEAIEGFKYAS